MYENGRRLTTYDAMPTPNPRKMRPGRGIVGQTERFKTAKSSAGLTNNDLNNSV